MEDDLRDLLLVMPVVWDQNSGVFSTIFLTVSRLTRVFNKKVWIRQDWKGTHRVDLDHFAKAQELNLTHQLSILAETTENYKTHNHTPL